MQQYLETVDYGHWSAQIASVLAIVGTFLGWFPIFAAMAACLYYLIQIYESKTMRGAIYRWRHRRIQKRLTRLKQLDRDLRNELFQLEPPGSHSAKHTPPE